MINHISAHYITRISVRRTEQKQNSCHVLEFSLEDKDGNHVDITVFSDTELPVAIPDMQTKLEEVGT